jgi:5-formyltetrahydrofolate cyclo-ligase
MSSRRDSGKAALRLQLLDARKARTPEQLQTARVAVAAHVLELARSARWRSVAAYRPLRTEPGSPELLSAMLTAGLRVITPVLLEDRDLDWTTEPDGADRLGAAAVQDVDAVLLPALAVSSTGMRLGRGGGSYDRVLVRLVSTPTYALVFDTELLEDVPQDPWDRAVGAAITPSGVVRLGSPRGGGLDVE